VTGAAAMTDGPQGLLLPADAVVIALGLALALGGLASAAWLRGRGSDWRGRTLARAREARRGGFALALAGLALAPVLEAGAMGDPPGWPSTDTLATLLRHTHYGHAALAGLAAWLAAGALVLAPRTGEPGRVRQSAGLLAILVVIATRSAVSHADARGDASLAVAVDVAHVALAVLWVGIVFAGARLALPPESARRADRADAMHWVARMSATATCSLAGVVATGAFKAWEMLAPAGPLLQAAASDYGRLLALKLALVTIAALLGGINRFRVLPALAGRQPAARAGDGARWRRRLLAILRVEALVLLLVMTAAALLAGTEPPALQAPVTSPAA
jgi:putative copper resistance protein D